MGELHLEIIVDRMKREFKVETNIGKPQVAFRETITKKCIIDYVHKKQSGCLPLRYNCKDISYFEHNGFLYLSKNCFVPNGISSAILHSIRKSLAIFSSKS